jgi:pyruvate formate lyase activating enzyme
MIIGGMQKTSFVDWPEKICTTLFIAGCNFRCGFCHNPDLVLPESIETLEPVSENEVLTTIVARKKYIDGVCITGGEPLLSPDIVRLIRKIKDKGLEVKVDTNGSVPTVLQKLIDENLVDYVAMDIKGPKERYEEITGSKVNVSLIEKSIKILQESSVKYEFRTTVVKGIISKDDIILIGKWLKGAPAYYLQSFVSSVEMVDPELKDRKTWTPDEMRDMKKAVDEYFGKVEVRGI